MSTTPTEFNVRIYGLFIHNGALLVSDELLQGQPFTKLPGGGLEFGESPIECLHRECYEELNASIIIHRHFYTTTEYVQSYFRPWQQVICIYFLAEFEQVKKLAVTKQKMNFDYSKTGNQESFRWVKLNDLLEETFIFLSDKKAVNLLLKKD